MKGSCLSLAKDVKSTIINPKMFIAAVRLGEGGWVKLSNGIQGDYKSAHDLKTGGEVRCLFIQFKFLQQFNSIGFLMFS